MYNLCIHHLDSMIGNIVFIMTLIGQCYQWYNLFVSIKIYFCPENETGIIVGGEKNSKILYLYVNLFICLYLSRQELMTRQLGSTYLQVFLILGFLQLLEAILLTERLVLWMLIPTCLWPTETKQRFKRYFSTVNIYSWRFIVFRWSYVSSYLAVYWSFFIIALSQVLQYALEVALSQRMHPGMFSKQLVVVGSVHDHYTSIVFGLIGDYLTDKYMLTIIFSFIFYAKLSVGYTRVGRDASARHMTNPEKLNLDYVNPLIITGLKIQKVVAVSSNAAISLVSKFCCCAKSVLKVPLYFLPKVSSVKLATYGSCPVNVLAGIVGRHSYTHLVPDVKVVSAFE